MSERFKTSESVAPLTRDWAVPFLSARWSVALLLFASSVINYLDRSAFSVAAPLVKNEFGLTPSQLGFVFSGFFFGYAAFSFIGGYCADRFGARNVLAVAAASWSVFCGLIAFTVGFASLFIVRLLFGAAEGPHASNINKLIGQWFPRGEEARALSVINSGAATGGAIAGPIVGFATAWLGWRVPFLIIALLGLLWVAVWLWRVTEKPEQSARVSEHEREMIARTRQPAGTADAPPTSYYLKDPRVIATIIAFFGYTYLLYFFLSWFPSYLSSAHHLDVKRMGMVNAIPWLCGIVGVLSGGTVCDWLFRITGNAILARKLVLVTSLFIAGCAGGIAGIVSGIVPAVTLMAIAVFFIYFSGQMYWAIFLEIVDARRVGTVGGFGHLVANCSGIIAPIITGYLVQWTGSFAGAFVLAGLITLAGALSVAIFLDTRPREASSV